MINGNGNPVYPKIGIRPTVDGRWGGVRESLEAKTFAMAQAVAQLYSRHLRYPNGSPVECVIADTCIGGVYESAQAAEKFAREGVGVSLTVSASWCYGTETMDTDPHIPKAIWGFNSTERPGAVYLAAALAGYNQKGLPAFSIYGRNVQEASDTTIPEDVKEKLLRFAKSALAVAIIRGKSYLSIGSVSMGIAGCIIDESFFQNYMGMRNEYVDMTELVRRMERNIFDQEEFKRALDWVKKHCPTGEDRNYPDKRLSDEQKARDWETVVKMALICRDLMLGNPKLKGLGYPEEAMGRHAIAGGFQGQRQWTDHLPNGDFMEAVLNSTFDWNGKRQPLIFATENDSLNGITMLFGHLLTHTAQIFADVRSFWSPEAVERVTGKKLEGPANQGVIHLLNSGAAALDGTGQQAIGGQPAMKPFWDVTDEEIDRCLQATSWRPANLEYFRGGGYSSDFTTRGGMPVTMARINIVKGLGPVLQLAEGYTVDLPPDVRDTLEDRTDPTWPSTWFVPRLTGRGSFTDVYTVMNHWGSNHCSLNYGHVGADMITLSSMLRIPVAMHNVPEAHLFRPSVWTAFGSEDATGADFRACATFGPLYK
jgi:L-fucose isomerase